MPKRGQLTELPVDSANKLIDQHTKVLVFLHFTTSGDSNLYQDNRPNKLGMVRQECFQSPDLLWKSFDIIQPIDAYHDFASLEFAFEGRCPLPDFGLGKSSGESLWLYTDRKGPDLDDPTLECNISTRRR